jgi:ferredoxin
MPKVTFVNEKRTIEVPEGACLRTEALNNGIQVHEWPHQGILNCHGFGSCATCSVEIVDGVENVSRQGFREWLRFLTGPITFFMRIGREKSLRLACQCRVNGDCKVLTNPPVNWSGEKFWE